MTSIISLNDAFNDAKLLSQISQGDIIAWHSEQRALLASLVEAHIMVSESRAQLQKEQSETAHLEEINATHRRSLMQLQSALKEAAEL